MASSSDKPSSKRAIGQLFAAASVVLSLLFVGWEIRQNTLTARATAVQESIDVAREQLHLYASDHEAARIRLVGRANPDNLNPIELDRYGSMVTSAFWGWQGIYRQWEIGVLSEDEWTGWNRVVCRNIAFPGVQTIWISRLREIYTPDFVATVESCEEFAGP